MIGRALPPAALLLLASCHGGPMDPSSSVDLRPFQEKARGERCADHLNLLFLVDGERVFSARSGSCADAAFGNTLYGSTPDQVLCDFYDSIAGPMKGCSDQRDLAAFDTMIAHVHDADLGLGPGHTVSPVPF
jgi:hypothetical protein